jgi:glycosyltransferase involved in cell wall biosynthesis
MIVTFTNLFPSSVMPAHGVFVFERMRRVAAASGLPWQVVAPVPRAPAALRCGIYRQWAAVPEHEHYRGVAIAHPRYRHVPGFSLRRQPDAFAAGARAAVAELAGRRRIVLDAHYLYPDGVAAALLARELGVPYTLTARGTDLNVLANDARIAARIRDASAGALVCAAVSGALCDRFAEVTGLPREGIREVRNGVDLELFRPGDPAVARRELGLPPDGRLLLGVGRLVAGKGFARAAAALAELPPDVHLVLVGEGPERAAIAAATRGRVVFLGALAPARVALAYQACDLLVLPSEREGWPNVVTEALACGLRVVATRVGGIPEILADSPGDGTVGALVPPGDHRALVDALRGMLRTPGDRSHVRAFAERYGWDGPVQALAAIFRAAMGATAA